MKKLIVLLMLGVFTITGCSILREKKVDPNYAAYTQTLQAQFKASKEPLVNISVDNDGKIAGIIVNQPQEYVPVLQKAPHPVWRVASGLIKITGIVGSIWATGEAIEGIVEAGNGTSTYINSANDNSGNSGAISTTTEYDYADTKTTDTTVDTTADVTGVK